MRSRVIILLGKLCAFQSLNWLVQKWSTLLVQCQKVAHTCIHLQYIDLQFCMVHVKAFCDDCAKCYTFQVHHQHWMKIRIHWGLKNTLSKYHNSVQGDICTWKIFPQQIFTSRLKKLILNPINTQPIWHSLEIWKRSKFTCWVFHAGFNVKNTFTSALFGHCIADIHII